MLNQEQKDIKRAPILSLGGDMEHYNYPAFETKVCRICKKEKIKLIAFSCRSLYCNDCRNDMNRKKNDRSRADPSYAWK